MPPFFRSSRSPLRITRWLPSLVGRTPHAPLADVEEARRQEFLLRLSALSRELGVTIEGCGCCGSPFLRSDDDSEDASARRPVVYDAEAREYLQRER